MRIRDDSGGAPLVRDALEHQPGHHRSGVLVLTGDQVTVDDEMVGEEVAQRMGPPFEEGTGGTQRGFRMQRVIETPSCFT
ncbi:MAG: hypothetical protein R2862_01195 [Thermoanaerobaculia bacterium]